MHRTTRRAALAHTLRASAGLVAAATPLLVRAGDPGWGAAGLPSRPAPALPSQGAGVVAAPSIVLFSERPFISRSQQAGPLPDNLIAGFGFFSIEGRGLGGSGDDPAHFGKVYITSSQLPARFRGRFDLDARTWTPQRIAGYVGSLEVAQGHGGASLVVETRSGQRLTRPIYVSPWPEKG